MALPVRLAEWLYLRGCSRSFTSAARRRSDGRGAKGTAAPRSDVTAAGRVEEAVEQQVSMSKYMPKPESPREIKLTYQALGSHGRMEDRVVVQSLPEECTVQKLIDMCYSIVAASPRQPLELHYWGRLLEPSKLLRDYALKPHSELKVVIRPKLPRSLLKGPAADLSLLRMVSSKLALPLVIDNITSETTGAELKVLASAQIKREAIWFCRQTADDPEACEKAGTMPIKQGEQLTTEAGAKASLRMRRIRDGEVGAVEEANVAQLVLPPEGLRFLFEGEPIADEEQLAKHKLIDNEVIFLDFKWPWVAEEVEPAAGKAAVKNEKGGKKK